MIRLSQLIAEELALVGSSFAQKNCTPHTLPERESVHQRQMGMFRYRNRASGSCNCTCGPGISGLTVTAREQQSSVTPPTSTNLKGYLHTTQRGRRRKARSSAHVNTGVPSTGRARPLQQVRVRTQQTGPPESSPLLHHRKAAPLPHYSPPVDLPGEPGHTTPFRFYGGNRASPGVLNPVLSTAGCIPGPGSLTGMRF
jgi:hypothetical protein